MTIIISKKIEDKLRDKHKVSKREVEQCFDNLLGNYLLDSREKHQSNPPTMWFVSTTNTDRLLKVVFIYRDNKIFIRSAFEPNVDELTIYINSYQEEK